MKKRRIAVLLFFVLSLVVVAVLLRPNAPAGSVDMKVAKITILSSKQVKLWLVIENNMNRLVNVVDDARGEPAFVVDTGNRRYWVGALANSGALNLAPGTALTNNVVVTNFPPRFRMEVPIRDREAESGGAIGRFLRVLPRRWTEGNLKWAESYLKPEPIRPTTDWIEMEGSNNPIDENGEPVPPRRDSEVTINAETLTLSPEPGRHSPSII